MKRNILTLSTLLFFLILIACTIPEQKTQETNKASIQQPTKYLTTPLFAVTGFIRETNNISLNDLGKEYCEGKVYVLESVKPQVDKIFQCNNAKTIKSLKDFATLAKDNILITDINNLISQYKALNIDNINFFESPENYPLYALGDDKEKFDYKSKVTKFTLTGVTAMTRRLGPTLNQNGVKWLTEKVIQEFKNSDLVHISNEVSFKDGCGFNTGRQFCSLEAHFEALKDLGTDIVELTGNHNLDHGKEPYIQTMEWYKKNNMKTFGGGLNAEEAQKPLLVELKDGKKIAFVGFNEFCPLAECYTQKYGMGANPYDSLKAVKVIKELKNNPEVSYVIVSVQFGEVDSYAPSKTQAKITRHLIDMGADMVYGSQAHQVQQIEFYKGKPIFHGLGNFLFDQTHRIGVRQAYFLHNYFYNGKMIQSVPVFTMESMEIRPYLATPQETAEMKKVVYVDNMVYKW